MKNDLREYTKMSFKNRVALTAQPECSCYHCKQVFDSTLVVEWVDGDETGICPKCGVDGLLPGRFSKEDLASIHRLCTD